MRWFKKNSEDLSDPQKYSLGAWLGSGSEGSVHALVPVNGATSTAVVKNIYFKEENKAEIIRQVQLYQALTEFSHSAEETGLVELLGYEIDLENKVCHLYMPKCEITLDKAMPMLVNLLKIADNNQAMNDWLSLFMFDLFSSLVRSQKTLSTFNTIDGDLKPANIGLLPVQPTQDTTNMLHWGVFDFGCSVRLGAKSKPVPEELDSEFKLTLQTERDEIEHGLYGKVTGTKPFIAPEVLVCRMQSRARDIWSIGTLFNILLSSRQSNPNLMEYYTIMTEQLDFERSQLSEMKRCLFSEEDIPGGEKYGSETEMCDYFRRLENQRLFAEFLKFAASKKVNNFMPSFSFLIKAMLHPLTEVRLGLAQLEKALPVLQSLLPNQTSSIGYGRERFFQLLDDHSHLKPEPNPFSLRSAISA